MLPIPIKPSRADFVIAGFTIHLSKACARILLFRHDDLSALSGIALCPLLHVCFVLSSNGSPINWVRLAVFQETYPAPHQEHSGAEEKAYQSEIEDEYVQHVNPLAVLRFHQRQDRK